jgi:hypothetical protein
MLMASLKPLGFCHLLVINTNTAAPCPDIWQNHCETIVQDRGRLLGENDFQNVDIFLGFLVNNIVDWMLVKMREWERDVASQKRGIANRLFKAVKYFQGSKPAASSTVVDTNGITLFSYSSSEMILRRLADFAFVLRDYKYAYGVYELLKKDFAVNDKFGKYLAGVQEMTVLTMLMVSDIRGSFDNIIDSAIRLYTVANCQLLACRCCVLIAELMRSRLVFRDAASLYIRAAADVSIHNLGCRFEVCHIFRTGRIMLLAMHSAHETKTCNASCFSRS